MKYNFISVVTISSIIVSSIVGITILIKSRKTRRIHLPLVLFMFSANISIFSIGFLIYTENYKILPHLLSYSSIATLLVGPFFYIYIKQLLFPTEKIRKALHFLPAITVFFLMLPYQIVQGQVKIMYINRLLHGQISFLDPIFCGSISLIGILSMMVYFTYSYYLLRKKKKVLDKHGQQKDQRLKSWLIFVVYNNLLLVIVLFISTIISIYAGFNLHILYKTVPVTASICIFLLSLRILTQPEIFLLDKAEVYSPTLQPGSSGVLEEIMRRKIETTISKNEYYKDPELTLPALARKVGIPRTTLSKTINSEFKMNFYDFINKLRIDEFKKVIAANPCQSNILDTAFALGFKSKSTFNTCFKRYEQMTPTQFKNQIIEKEKSEYSLV